MLGYKFENVEINNLTTEHYNEIRKAIPEHGVICIKNQELKEEDLIQFTKKLGMPVLLPEALRFNNTKKEYPELARVSNILPDGTLLKSHKAAEYWHSDGDFWQPGKNYIYNLLYSKIVPDIGGETGFADLRMAYDALSHEIKERIAELEVVVCCDEIPDFKDTKPEDRQPDAYHRITHKHVETSRVGLYIGHTLAKINKVPKEESDFVIRKLVDEIENPANQYMHKWEVGDLLIWDNTSVMHRSMGGYGDFPRLLFRTQAFMTPPTKQQTVETKQNALADDQAI